MNLGSTTTDNFYEVVARRSDSQTTNLPTYERTNLLTCKLTNLVPCHFKFRHLL